MKKFICSILSIIILCICVGITYADTKLYNEEDSIPSYYIENCPKKGLVENKSFKNKDNKSEPIYIWTPYNYSNKIKFEVILLLHGYKDNPEDWHTTNIEISINNKNVNIQLSNIYDWLTYENKCKPFIVCSIQNKNNAVDVFESIIYALKYIVDNYNTYAKSSLDENIIEARKHITIGGFSKGGLTTCYFLSNYIEYAYNYILMSFSKNNFDFDNSFEKEMNRNINKSFRIFIGSGETDEYYKKKNVIKDEKYYSEYADNSVFYLYPWGHTWTTWVHAIYDSLVHLFGISTVDKVNYIVNDFIENKFYIFIGE